jgi:hypothetical protein
MHRAVPFERGKGLKAVTTYLMPFTFYLQIAAKKRADERSRTADLEPLYE